jgi:hypothetical protein
MKSRIAIWAVTGALVVVCWTLYVTSIFPSQMDTTGAVWTLLQWMCPISFAPHFAMSFYTVMLANAATYALVGLIVEGVRGRTRHAQFQH